MRFRIFMIDSANQRALVAILRRGERIIEVKWVSLAAVKLAGAMSSQEIVNRALLRIGESYDF